MNSLIARLRLWQKFALVSGTCLLLAMAACALVLQARLEALRSAQTEQSGLQPAEQVLRLIQLSQQHRGLSNGALSGNTNRVINLVDDLLDGRNDHARLFWVWRQIERLGAIFAVIGENALRAKLQHFFVILITRQKRLNRDGQLRECLILNDGIKVRQIVGNSPVEIGNIVNQ